MKRQFNPFPYLLLRKKAVRHSLKLHICFEKFQVKLQAPWVPTCPRKPEDKMLQEQGTRAGGASAMGNPALSQGDTHSQGVPTLSQQRTHTLQAARERVKWAVLINTYHRGGTMPGPWWDHPGNWGVEQSPTIQKLEDFFLLKYGWFLNLYKNKKTFVTISKQIET